MTFNLMIHLLIFKIQLASINSIINFIELWYFTYIIDIFLENFQKITSQYKLNSVYQICNLKYW